MTHHHLSASSHYAAGPGPGSKGDEDGGAGGEGGLNPHEANLQRVMTMIEKLEDELARMTAKKEQVRVRMG